jgi:hypothetical protein
MPKGRPRLSDEEKASRKAERALIRAYTPQLPPEMRIKRRRLTAEEKDARATEKAIKKAERAILKEEKKIAKLFNKETNKLNRQISRAYAPKLPYGFAKKTQEERMAAIAKKEAALDKPKRKYVRSYASILSAKPRAPRARKEIFPGLTKGEYNKLFKAEAAALRKVQRLAETVALPPVAVRRVKRLKQYPSAPAYR